MRDDAICPQLPLSSLLSLSQLTTENIMQILNVKDMSNDKVSVNFMSERKWLWRIHQCN